MRYSCPHSHHRIRTRLAGLRDNALLFVINTGKMDRLRVATLGKEIWGWDQLEVPRGEMHDAWRQEGPLTTTVCSSGYVQIQWQRESVGFAQQRSQRWTEQM